MLNRESEARLLPNIIDLAGRNATAGDRRKSRRIGIAFDSKEAELALAKQRVLELEAQVARLTTKKRKAVPNPNKKFMQLREILGGKEDPGNALNQDNELEEQVEDEIAVGIDEESEDDEEEDEEPPAEAITRSGRATKVPPGYID